MELARYTANCHTISCRGMLILFSYGTPVAAEINNIYYKTTKQWSQTTTKHINSWLKYKVPLEKDQSFFDGLGETP